MRSNPPEPADLPMSAPELKTDTVRVGDSVVCVLSGDLYVGTHDVGDRALRTALDLRPALLAVDLDAVELFTADGLNLLLGVRDTARARGVPLALVSPSEAVRHVLEVTGAAGSFDVHPTVAEAAARHAP
ncbi:STAS domain-containing protein [Streptomyces sp. NPDC058746]|uniref:STAS domain-containing protein n=1 Tax=Streptomyces sp. NPDC058746 TaxID=3346622 RepID=UPI00368A6E20